jgi:murein DD-endopeptidase MepM/ murein hydrolase activator NlpD
MMRVAVLLTTVAILGGCTAVDDMSDGRAHYQVGYMIAPMPGETLERVAARFNVPSSALIAANHLRPPYTLTPNQTLIIPPPATYVVRDGDSVEGIATNLGVDEASLAQANGLSEPYHMRVGQVLHVPGGYGPGGGAGGADYTADAPVTVAPSVAARSSISAQPLAPPPSGGAPRPNGMAQPLPPPPPGYTPPPQSRTMPPSSSQTALAPPPSGPTPIAPPPRSAPPQAAQLPAMGPQVAMTPPPPTGGPHFLRPVSGATVEGFGASSGGQTNDGINIAAPAGTPVKASDAGTVIYTGNELSAFGNLVLIRHAGGWVTAYGHLATIGVQKGTTVVQGQPIGTVGQTGSAPTPQLHFEIRQGSKPVDPAPFLGGRG